jgi:hypothetical protein
MKMTSTKNCVQAGDWVTFDGTDFIVTEVESETCFFLKKARWYHKLWKWLNFDF